MKDEAKKILKEISNSLDFLADSLDESFSDAVELIFNSKGNLIITGLGKSGLIGKKMAATFSSTGTPSFFIHAVEAFHGDIGMINESDVIIAISHSGETKELLDLIPFLKRKGVKIISITHDKNSELGKNSDITLETMVKKEAGEFGLAPTTSTTLTLSLGDALALCLFKKRDLKPKDFALFHPGGSLGKKLCLKVSDLMHSGDLNPLIGEQALIKDAILEISSKGLGAVSIVDSEGKLRGIITDGNLRRVINEGGDVLYRGVQEVMTRNPVHILHDRLATEAVHLMEDRPSQIPVLPVVDSDKKVVGMIRVHDLIRAGIN